jgi:hypothetical protein
MKFGNEGRGKEAASFVVLNIFVFSAFFCG